GGMVMYLLRDQIGEETVNRALRSLIHDYAFKGPPYPRSIDLVERLRAAAGPDPYGQALITDLFEKITLYDLKVTTARSSKRPDGKWDLTVQIQARKLYATGKGVETEAPLDSVFDIGVFANDPRMRANMPQDSVISVERQRMQTGQHTLTMVVDR